MNGSLRRVALLCGLMLVPVIAQEQPAAPPPPNQPQLSPQQLESMVAPIALYPDSLLSQVLVASTYPLELVEAEQWLQQHQNVKGSKLLKEAKKQQWDPSVQALVPFPDVIQRLTSDIRWATDLGNAFLAQQADVMNAVQHLRAEARDSGKLTDTPQQNVVVENQDGQSAIEIQPADPQVIYVPTYDPGYFWGPPPPMYPWPELYYPGIDIGWGWGGGINLGFYFGGCCGWGGWGWGPRWFDHSVYVNNGFFHRYDFHDFHGDGSRGFSDWSHDAGHRGGVPYPNSAVAQRFQGGGGNFRGGNAGGMARPNPSSLRFNRGQQGGNFGGGFGGNRQAAQRGDNHSAFGGISDGNRARMQSDHGFSSLGSARTAPAFHGGGFHSGGGFGGGGGGFRGGGGGGRGRGR